MKGQNEIQVIEVEAQGCPLCDGCGKQISTGSVFLKWFWRETGEDVWETCYMDNELHSHNRENCIGKVMRKIFS